MPTDEFTGEEPDVDPETGDERETTGLDEHGDPLSLNLRYDPDP